MAPAPLKLYRLEVLDFVGNFFTKQKLSFQLICLYLFIEYVRPQSIYELIADWPLASISILLCLGAFVVDGIRLRRLTLADPLLLLYSAIVLMSAVTAYSPEYAMSGMGPSYFHWILIYLLITNIVTTEKQFLIFSFLYCLWSYKMSLHAARSFALRGFSFADWGVTCSPGFFQNSGECGIQMAIFFPISLYFFLALKTYWDRKRRWILGFMPATAAIAIMGTSSRGAQLALAAVLLWVVLRSRQRLKVLAIATLTAGLLYAILPADQMDRFREMGTDETSLQRRQYWTDGIQIMNDFPVLGIGFNNWLPFYRTEYDPKGHQPHNIFVQAGVELGYSGLAVFVMLIIATFVTNAQTRRMARKIGDARGFMWSMAHGLDGALIGYLVSGFFVTVLYYPFFWINLALTVSLQTAARNKLARTRPPERVTTARALGLAAPDAGMARLRERWRTVPRDHDAP